MEPEPGKLLLSALPSNSQHHTAMSQETTTNTTLEVPDFFRDTINKNSLCASVGHRMFCPHCDELLDWRRAVEASAWSGPKCISVHVVCGSCWDRTAPHVRNILASKNLTLELIDGRELKRRLA